jgi:hypothetical protein
MQKVTKQFLALNPAQQSDLKLLPSADWHFAANELLIPLAYSEMADAAREYPLVFLKDKPVFYALLGFEKGVNAYVADDGHWRARYIPARLRAYPIALAPVKESPGKFAIVADADAPQLSNEAKAGSEPLFINGKPSPALQARIDLLQALQKAEPATQKLVQAIRDADLLVDRAIQVKMPSADHPALGGFQVIDEKKLYGLSDAKYNKLRKAGALPLVYAHLLSMANLRQGAIAGKYPELATPGDQVGRPAPADMDDLLKGVH